MGYFLVYIRRWLSSRLCFHVFWEAGRDRIFLVSEPCLLKEDLILTGYLRQVIFALQYTYTIHTMILTQFGVDRPPFWNPSLEFFMSLISTILLEWSGFHLDSYSSCRFYFLILSFRTGYSILKRVAEIRARNGSAMDSWCSEKWRGSLIFSLNLISYHSLLYENFEDEIFYKVSRMWYPYFEIQGLIIINYILICIGIDHYLLFYVGYY